MSRPPLRLIVAALLALAAIAGLVALGTWQVHRLAWKRALIAQVDARIHRPPVPAPGPPSWPSITPATAQYRHVQAEGRFLPAPQTLVQASTGRGAGWWVLTPLRTRAGWLVLVNRGFVTKRAAPAPPPGEIAVTGLLRISEPGGGFLRANDPAADRWYSRDIAAIAAHHRLQMAAPYFIDADAASFQAGGPVGGLTVIAIPNNHLVYALTWYGLAVMVAAAFLILLRSHRRSPAI